MNKNAITLTVLVFVVLVVGMFGFAYLKKSEVTEQIPEDNVEGDVKYASISRVNAKHFYIDGVHTLAGEIPMPTPCDLLDTDAFVAESFPEQVLIDFSVVNNADFCEQVVTPARFKVSVTASENATFRAKLQGREVELNLIPALPGETPDDFEVFIKG